MKSLIQLHIVIREFLILKKLSLPLAPSHPHRERERERERERDTFSPTLHWSRILYKSLPLVTFLPFTDVMMSPKMSLPQASRLVGCRPCSMKIDQLSLNGRKKLSNLKKLMSIKEGRSKQSISPNNHNTNFNNIYNS